MAVGSVTTLFKKMVGLYFPAVLWIGKISGKGIV